MPATTVLERERHGGRSSALSPDPARRVVIVLSGAGTRSRGRHPNVTLPTDFLHHHVTERLYRAIGGDELVHPPWFGLGPPDWIYSWIRPVLERKLAKYPGRRFLLVGHSLGGYLGTVFAHGHPGFDIETVAISSPFGTVTGMPGTGRVFSVGHLRQQRSTMGERAPRLTLIGSDGDRLIRPSSALPDLPGATRVLLTTDRHAGSADPERVLVGKAPGHLALINHPEVLARIVASASAGA